jgi:hypothetical protein
LKHRGREEAEEVLGGQVIVDDPREPPLGLFLRYRRPAELSPPGLLSPINGHQNAIKVFVVLVVALGLGRFLFSLAGSAIGASGLLVAGGRAHCIIVFGFVGGGEG